MTLKAESAAMWPKNADSNQNLREDKSEFCLPQSLQKECGPTNSVSLYFWPSELGENKFMLF